MQPSSQTDGKTPVGTDAPQPDAPATPEPQSAPAATDDDKVTLSRKDYTELQAQRDRANEALRGREGQDAFVASIAQERYVGDFLKANAEKYPDVKLDDLTHLDDPGDEDALLHKEAARMQRRFEDVVQNKLLNVQKETPTLSPEERSAKLEKLRKNPGSESFQEMLELGGSQ